ncbi:MAG: hypothetical protein HYY45_05055 [Deltaproteobacteria bacterium]|nr:hypothetical protein [Deltaproteobacteria bacterium]
MSEYAALVVLIGVVISAFGAYLVQQRESQVQEQLRFSVTGGDGFPYLDVSIIGEKPPRATLMVHNGGRFPLYDVDVRMAELSKQASEERDLSIYGMEEANLQSHVGTLPPGGARIIDRWGLPEQEDRHDYNVFISARNRFVIENIRLRRIENRWRSAIRVFQDVGGKRSILLERIDKEFPRSETGEVRW